MRRVTGIGGIFMSAKDPMALCDRYKKPLGIDVQDWGGAAFTWTDSGQGNYDLVGRSSRRRPLRSEQVDIRAFLA